MLKSVLLGYVFFKFRFTYRVIFLGVTIKTGLNVLISLIKKSGRWSPADHLPDHNIQRLMQQGDITGLPVRFPVIKFTGHLPNINILFT